MAKRNKTPQQHAAAWQQGMQGAGQAYIQGCQNPKQDPIAAASTPQASANYIAGINRSEAAGLRVAGLQKAGTQGWLAGVTGKGAAALASAGQRKLNQYTQAMQSLAPVHDQMRQAAAGVQGPKGPGTAIAKVTAALQVLMAAGRRNRGGGIPGVGQ